MSNICDALKRGEFSVLYQPEVACSDERIMGLETLVRWNGPPGVTQQTADIVRAAEKNGDIDRIGEWVLNRACQDAGAWFDLFIAVNVSPRQFRSAGFVDMTAKAAQLAGLPLNRLELEITENAYFDDFDRAVAELSELRSAGVKIALDDFGTGYSSLNHLKRLPLDRVKIDKSFVDGLSQENGAAILQAIVSLSKALGLLVTAEGVETRVQADFMKEIGCDCMQGFLFSSPLKADDVSVLINKRKIGAT